MIGVVGTAAVGGVGTRPEVESGSTLQSFAANPDRLQIAPTTQNDVEQGASLPQAGYVSPTVRVDVNAKIAVLEFRDSLSGDVVAQVPSREQLRAYRVRQAKERDAVVSETMSSAQKVQEARTEGLKEPQKIDTTTVTAQDYTKYQEEATANS